MVSARGKSQTQQPVLTLLNSFFENFQIWINQANNPTSADLQKFLTPNFELVSNGELLCSGVAKYAERVGEIRSQCAHFDIAGPLEEPLFFEDSKILVQYEASIRTKDGKKEQVYMMAIATIENDKFSNWTQVTHSKNSQHSVLSK